MHVQARHASETVMKAYHKAASFAEESGNLKHQVLYACHADMYRYTLVYTYYELLALSVPKMWGYHYPNGY